MMSWFRGSFKRKRPSLIITLISNYAISQFSQLRFQSIKSLQYIDNIVFISDPSEELASHPHFTKKGRKKQRQTGLLHFYCRQVSVVISMWRHDSFKGSVFRFTRVGVTDEKIKKQNQTQSNNCVFHKSPQSYNHPPLPPFRSQKIVIKINSKISVQGAKSNHYEISFAFKGGFPLSRKILRAFYVRKKHARKQFPLLRKIVLLRCLYYVGLRAFSPYKRFGPWYENKKSGNLI